MYDNSEEPKPISNFRPEVIALVNVYADADTEPVPYVKMRLDFGDGRYSEEFTESLSGVENFNWLSKDIRSRFSPEVTASKAWRYLADAVRAALPKAMPRRLYRVNSLGTHIVDGEPVFCTGGGLISPPATNDNRPDIEVAPVPYTLDIDPTLGEAEAAVGMFELISLSPNAMRIIVAHILLYLMRKMYETVWKSPCCCVFLYGLTGTKKTTISALLTQMYNRSKGIESPTRLNASVPAAVSILYEKRDCVVVLDDLFPAESSQVRGEQEKTLVEITRIIADGIEPARMRGKQTAKKAPACGVLFTGEYLIGTGSNAARLLPVELSPSPDGEKLKRFQDNPLIVSTFYHNFIQWFIKNYDETVELLRAWRTAYSLVSLGVHDRLKETHFFMNTSYSLFMQYCFEIGIISEQDANILHSSFLGLLTNLVQIQDERVKRSKTNDPAAVDYLASICTLYKNGAFRLADNAKLFSQEHDGVIHNGCLCLRGENLRDVFPTNFEAVLDALVAQGALKCGKDRRTIQIHGTGGKRFYAIPLDKLR
jgi:hypothetical protein